MFAVPFFDDRDWELEALCKNHLKPEWWYPEQNNYHGGQLAKRVCLRCPVMKECLDWALKHDEEHGVWGATTPRERQRIKRGQRKKA